MGNLYGHILVMTLSITPGQLLYKCHQPPKQVNPCRIVIGFSEGKKELPASSMYGGNSIIHLELKLLLYIDIGKDKFCASSVFFGAGNMLVLEIYDLQTRLSFFSFTIG